MRKLACVMVIVLATAVANGADLFNWSHLDELPAATQDGVQPGLAGAFSGMHDGYLIVAGGANFPKGLPWVKKADGSSPRKIYHPDIYILDEDSGWRVADQKLPHGYSYGVSLSTAEGILCVGGEWRDYGPGGGVKKSKSDAVFLLAHDGQGGVRIDDSLPRLPVASSDMTGAMIGTTVFIAGGHDGTRQTRNFWSLDLSKRGDKMAFVWETLEGWPGPPRSHAVAAAQGDGASDSFYMFSGRSLDADGDWQFLTDGHRYTPSQPEGARWTRAAEVPVCVMAAGASKLGANHLVVFGGADGQRFQKVEQDMPREIERLRAAARDSEADALEAARWEIYTSHTGFSRKIWAYHTITDTWAPMGLMPENPPVTVNVVNRGGHLVLTSGEVRPAVRSPRMLVAEPQLNASFGTTNFIVLGVYLAALVVMGIYFSRGENSTEDFFKASGRIPWWAAGLSIFGTQLSAITFMAVPAKSFATDWTWAMMNIAIVIVAPFIVLLFLPFYRRLNVTTAYEYIEMRFDVRVRCIASAFFMVFQFARIGIVLFLPSIALSVVTGIDIKICIMSMAVLAMAYTVLGGIEAVIWTDVIQVVVLLGGALIVLVMIPGEVADHGGVLAIAQDADKLRMFDFHFDLKGPTFWVLVLGGLGGNLISYGSDQAVIQRYLTTPTEKDAARSIWTNAVLTIPATIIFFALGTYLYSFYKTHPAALGPALEKTDAIFPWFIVTQLPAGLSGLLIAGVFAAAMSSLDSSMNSVATAFTTDFYRRFKPGVADRACLRVARISTVVVGTFGMCFALAMVTWDIKSLWDEFATYIGFFGGGLGGLFLLAMFTRRATTTGALAGLVLSAAGQFYLKESGLVHGLLFSATGMISCFVIGSIVSRLTGREDRDLTGLTVYTQQKRK